jgi:hypothetical protein
MSFRKDSGTSWKDTTLYLLWREEDRCEEGFVTLRLHSKIHYSRLEQVIIVDRDSATFGLPGTRENIVDLQRNHSDICRFNFDNLEDIASYKIVQHNMRTAYNKIIESEDLMERLGGLNTPISAPSSSGQAALGPGR